MSDDIRSILNRLATVESKITPVDVKSGLNAQQRGVPQLPALFKPRNISTVLKSKKDPAHPMKGEFVGDSVEPARNALEEAMQAVEEDMLSKVKRDFVDYLERLETNNKIDRDLVHKAKQELEIEDPTEEIEEDPTQSEPAGVAPPAPAQDPVLPEGDIEDSDLAHDVDQKVMSQAVAAEQPVKTVAMEDGAVLEIYGDQGRGFEVRHGGRSLPTRFPNIDHADMAVKLFQRRRKKADLNQDYLEEK
jgi:hypothetical protein